MAKFVGYFACVAKTYLNTAPAYLLNLSETK